MTEPTTGSLTAVDPDQLMLRVATAEDARDRFASDCAQLARENAAATHGKPTPPRRQHTVPPNNIAATGRDTTPHAEPA